MPRAQTLRKKLAAIQLAVFDVDGTMTDGGMWLDARGTELKCFDVKDGLGLVLLRAAGVRTAIVSARTSRAVTLRARELKIGLVMQGAQDKARALSVVMRRSRVRAANILFMGDDVNDLPLLELVGVAACPSDAAREVRASVDLIAPQAAGHGAVRHVCEQILRARGMTPRTALNALLNRK